LGVGKKTKINSHPYALNKKQGAIGGINMAMQAIAGIDYMSALKVGAVGGLIWGIIVGIIALLAIGTVGTVFPGAGGAAAMGGVVGFVISIILGLIGGAIGGIIWAAIYNIIIAKLTGGLVIDLKAP